MRRRLLLAAAALLLVLPLTGSASGFSLSPILAVCVCASLGTRARWLAPLAATLGGAGELLVGGPRPGAAILVLASAGWLALRLRARVAPDHPLICGLYGLAGGLLGRLLVPAYCRFAGLDPVVGAPFWWAGPLSDGAFTAALAVAWWRRER
jgi:hypothetical protein